MKIFSVVLFSVVSLICLVFALMAWVEGFLFEAFIFTFLSVGSFVFAIVCANTDEEEAKAKAAANRKAIADRLMGRDRPVPIRAVLITASQGGKKNRLVDGAAGQILAGGMGAMVGLMGSGPKSTAVFYVTWSNGKVTTETVVIGSRPFMDYMAVTDQARDR